jgi:hypothetical protein
VPRAQRQTTFKAALAMPLPRPRGASQYMTSPVGPRCQSSTMAIFPSKSSLTASLMAKPKTSLRSWICWIDFSASAIVRSRRSVVHLNTSSSLDSTYHRASATCQGRSTTCSDHRTTSDLLTLREIIWHQLLRAPFDWIIPASSQYSPCGEPVP